jgi:hypothetical protein
MDECLNEWMNEWMAPYLISTEIYSYRVHYSSPGNGVIIYDMDDVIFHIITAMAIMWRRVVW